MATKIEIEDMITVGALAEKLSLPATKIIGELFKNGVMVTINEKIDFDTAQIIIDELNLDIELTLKKKHDIDISKNTVIHSKNAISRPPVVAVMGHVDHGKTSLLDVIRSKSVASGEAGGITQHITAYQVIHNSRYITFLDTPGHEAFAVLREHGAQLTDVSIIVIAAEDGIKPQTLEAIRYAKKANSKILVAITKIDKPEANVEKVKQQLSDNKMIPEEWGGDTIVVPVSSKTKEGVDKLLDMIILVADMEDLRADKDVPGEGLIIESHMEKGCGPSAVALVQKGTVRIGDFVVAGTTYAKTRLLQNTQYEKILEAGPATPIIISGFKTLPEMGDSFRVVENEKEAKSSVKSSSGYGGTTSPRDISSNELIRLINQKTSQKQLNIIIKADVQGSLASVIGCVKTLDSESVYSRIVSAGIGNISESDVRLALTSKSIIYGFQVDISKNVKQQTNRDKVDVRLFSVIYELLDDIRVELENLLEPELVMSPIGRLLIKAVFKTTKDEVICGGEVTKGVIHLPCLANVYRDDQQIAINLEVSKLKQGPSEVKEAKKGDLCGLSLVTESKLDVKEGDRIELFTKEMHQRSL